MDQRRSKQRDGTAVCRGGTKRWHPNTSALEASRDEDDIHLQQVRYASLSLSLSLVCKILTFTTLFLSFVTPGIRTERRVNKDNLTAGTTWVQCGNPSCSVWHKIVDNLGLVYECSDME